MAEKRTIELEVQDNSKSLKAQYRDAVKELQNIAAAYGETSDQAIKAAKAAADLKDQIEFSKDLVGAFNPDAKFDALTKSFGGVLDGFQAVEGGLALIGVEGEAVQETMLKVQSAMALSQGLQGLMSAKDSFKQLGAVAKTALSGIRSGIAATGIGLFVVALGTIVAYWDDIKEAVFGVSAEQKKLNEISLKNQHVAEKTLEDYENQNYILKLQGKTDKELLNGKIALQERVVKANIDNLNNLQTTYKAEIAASRAREKGLFFLYDIYKSLITIALDFAAKPIDLFIEKINSIAETVGLDKLITFNTEDIKKNAIGAINAVQGTVTSIYKSLGVLSDETKINEDIENAKTKLLISQNELAQSKLELRNENTKNELKSSKDSIDNVKNEAKEKLDLTRELIDKQIELIENPYEKERELLKEKAKREKEDLAKSIEGKIYDQEKYNESIKLIDEKLKKDLKQQDLNFMGEGLKAKKAGLDESLLLDKDAADKRLEIALQEQEKKKQLEKEEIERRNALRQKTLELTSDTFSALADLAGAFNTKNEQDAKRQFLIQKAFNLGAAITNTAMAVTGALTAGGNPIKLATGQQFVEAGIAAAVGAANIIKIANSRFGGGAGGGGNTDVPTPAAGGMTAQFNTIGSSGINQLATLQQQPVQAYVVSGEVTSAQSLDRNRVQNATL